MASHTCRFCLGVMDPRDGHRECPSCLGIAHVLEDVANPCAAAVELPREERACRAKRLELSVCAGAAQPDPSQFSEEGVHAPKTRSRKRKHERTPNRKRRRGSGEKQAVQPPDDPVDAPGGQGAHGDTQLQILAAIRGLSERLGRVEAQWPAMTGTPGEEHLKEPSPDELPSGQGDGGDTPDVISLYARDSPFGSGEQSDIAGSDEQLRSSAVEGMSNLSPAGGGESSAIDIISKIMSAAKIVGLNIPVVAPAPMDGVWAGISHSQHPISVPVAADYLHMLRKSWNAPSGAPQFNAGCRRLTKVMYAPDTGMGDMPPVEREMAALTSLGPERVTANPRCPVKECEKTDRLVCRSYNAATRAARSGGRFGWRRHPFQRTLGRSSQTCQLCLHAFFILMLRACWTKLNSLAALEIVCGAPLAEPRLPGMVLGVPSIQTIPLALARSRGGSMLVSRPLVIHNRRHAGSSGFSPVLPVKRGPTGDAPPGVRDDRLGPHRGGGSAAAVSSQLCLDSWEERVLDPWVLATVSTGYRIQFRRRPPPFSGVRMTTVRDPVQEKILAGEIATLLQKDAIMRVEPSEQLAGFYSLYFLVSKKDGGLRPILDLRRLNAFIKVLPFKMLTTSQILEAVEKGDWFTSVDLRDAYFHVPICPDHRPFLRFAFQGRAYQFKVLPFGLSLSPRVFTRVIGAALRPLQLSGMKILPYLDDWLICAPSHDQVLRDTGLVLSHIQSLGLKVNWTKTNLEPGQQVVFVGLRLDSVAMSVSLTSQRVGNILALLSHFRLGKRLELVQFQRLLGMISAAVAVVPLGLLRARPLQRWFNALGLHPKLHRRAKVRVTHTFLRALRPWRDTRLLLQGVPLGNIPSRRTVVTTDASLTGWGAVWEHRMVRGVWEPPWGEEHINVLELRAVFLALKALLPSIQGRHVLVRTDSSSTVFHVNHQGGTFCFGRLNI
ncbi:uncharacterized protein LOC115581658 [Sparus aurata]|uniref:uncharacterized protein LOC115581658 n=1 Tax=Sparus aurata TaxID=8175 RepID=UPI0011C13D29|nr:uncharacterized protein LOC115581658 [Sparus aurata]